MLSEMGESLEWLRSVRFIFSGVFRWIIWRHSRDNNKIHDNLSLPLTPLFNLFHFKCELNKQNVPERGEQINCYKKRGRTQKNQEEEAKLECLLIRICDMQMRIPWMAGIAPHHHHQLKRKKIPEFQSPADSRFVALALHFSLLVAREGSSCSRIKPNKSWQKQRRNE